MTITLNLNKLTLLRDISTLDAIFKAGVPELVQSISNILDPLNISLTPFTNNNVEIQVSLEEFALIGIFNKGKL